MPLQLQTPVDLPRADFEIEPCSRMLFLGSCFADNMGRLFADDCFRVTVNPYGVMYNPISVGHTIARLSVELPPDDRVDTVVITLGTNHIYILRATGEVVDNCQKRPQRLFEERELTVDDTVESLEQTIALIAHRWPEAHVILTVSPIRYRKYGLHGSQLSKSVLLLATAEIERRHPHVSYFPSYEIMNDELRDYRFYADDMLHPSPLAVEYIWQRMVEVFFSAEAKAFLKEWAPIKKGLAHRPFNADSDEYHSFVAKLHADAERLRQRYPDMPL